MGCSCHIRARVGIIYALGARFGGCTRSAYGGILDTGVSFSGLSAYAPFRIEFASTLIGKEQTRMGRVNIGDIIPRGLLVIVVFTLFGVNGLRL